MVQLARLALGQLARGGREKLAQAIVNVLRLLRRAAAGKGVERRLLKVLDTVLGNRPVGLDVR